MHSDLARSLLEHNTHVAVLRENSRKRREKSAQSREKRHDLMYERNKRPKFKEG